MIEDILKELREITGESFVYQQDTWAYNFVDYSSQLTLAHTIRGGLKGFVGVSKDTLQELIEAAPLIKEQIELILKANAVQKQLETKLIKNTYPIE